MLGGAISKILGVTNKICAFLVLASYALFATNAKWAFITNDTIMNIINVIMHYGPLVICSLLMVEFAAKRNFIVQLVIYALIAIVIIFQFFPDTFNKILGM